MTFSIKDRLIHLIKNYDILKPGRYLGGELNIQVKKKSDVNVSLCFPDMYEIGISNTSMNILYQSINELEYAKCERVYAVGADFANAIKEQNISLYTLETFSPVKSFDLLGFTLQYELLYTNILQVLDLSGIPLERDERGEDCPIIIAGGPSVYNPTPLEDFIDLFFIGEADIEIKNIVNIIKEMKEKNTGREAIIKRLSLLPFIHSPKYRKEKTVRTFVDSIDNIPIAKPLVPLLEGVQNRLSIEIARGCTHACRFCLAGITYRPIRMRSVENIINIVKTGVRSSGATDISLTSLSADDYPNIRALIEYLQELGKIEGFSLSLPSLRIDSFDLETAKKIAEFKKTGLTFALEVGSTLLRQKINKTMNEDAIKNIVGDLKNIGWKTIKIYFMIGFTKEAEDEMDSIIDTLKELSKIAGNGVRINASINVFVPKPHTPLENVEQLTDEEAIELIHKAKNVFYKTNVMIKFHPPRMAELEGILTRGDKLVGRAILDAYKMGACFDAWVDCFNYDIWLKAFNNLGIDKNYYLKNKQEKTWKHIDTLITDNYLEREYKKFESAEFTEDCRESSCKACGIDNNKYCKKDGNEKFLVPTIDTSQIKKDDVFKNFTKLLIKYKKEDIASLLGMHDIKRVIIQGLKIIGLKLTYTQGYHPLPKMTFSEPTGFGVSSDCEYIELSIRESIDIEKLKTDINTLLKNMGVEILTIEEFVPTIKKINTLPKNTVYRLITSDDEKANTVLQDKDKMKTHCNREGDYMIAKNRDGILITILHAEKNIIRTRDIKDYLSSFGINILDIRKLSLL